MELKALKGIGEKRIKYLEFCGINTVNGLAEFLPCSYKDMREYSLYNACDAGTHNLIRAEVLADPVTNYVRKNFISTIVKCKDEEDTVFYAQWFNQPYVKMRIKKGGKYLFFGVVSHKSGKKIINPSFDDAVSPKKLKGIMPVYRKIEGLPAALVKELIDQSVSLYEDFSYLPENIKQEFGISEIKDAYRMLHNPKSFKDIESANRTISLSELTKIMYAYKQHKLNSYGSRTNSYSNNADKLNLFIESLPFKLTESQNKAVDAILNDLNKPLNMNRMIAGDVGSGKTIVALISMYNAVLSGYQSALMAPTEVLARQHYRNAIKLLAPFGVRVKYYAGSLNKNDRESVLFDIRNGNADIIIGTHALIQDNVKYQKLALVITDELHRFGVSQRNKLETKGDTDVLVMSATPLPRTLALVFYSDLEVSYLEYPKSRADKVTTNFVPGAKVEDMFGFIKQLSEKGQQSYIICPRIDDTDENDDIMSACGLYKKLKEGVYKDIPVGLLHGRLKEDEKQRVVNKFNDGEIKILVSTTVIEVGIDVKNAAVMAIFGAERYGLAQLHQLRGRVGRGEYHSYCFLITDTRNPVSVSRLNKLKSCSDGFELSDYDLSVRGAGDFIGERQSGAGDLFFRLTLNRGLIEDARNILEKIEQNPDALSRLRELTYQKYGDTILRVTMN